MAVNKSILAVASSYLTLFSLFSYLALVPGVSGMYFVSRDEWKARKPEEAYKPITKPKGVKIHYLGNLFTGREHSECDDMMRSVQDEHMDKSSENYFDIAYSMAVCQHGYVYDGRGKGHQSGANGNKELNAEHYAVLGFVAKYGVHSPSQEMITGFQDAIAYLRRAGAGSEIKGHRDGYSTECPGGDLYKLVKDGTLDPGKLWDGGKHVVKEGEDLGSISEKYNVPKRYIIDRNDLKSPYTVKVGQELDIPARGVPLDEKPSGNDGGSTGGSDNKLIPFPGGEWFKNKPNSTTVLAMGKRLVEEECNAYKASPSTQWTDADQASYKLWQQKLGYTGAEADGWPGQTSWDKLKVPK